MQLDEHQERDWKRAQRWADCCRRGDCAYVNADAPTGVSGDGCPGIHCVLHIEDGRPVLRYRNCWRKAAWWKKRQEAIRARKAPVKLVRRAIPEDDERG